MKQPHKIGINYVSPETSGAIASPELLWICTNSPDSCLWPRGSIGQSSRLEKFAEVVLMATVRVLIMDPHFDGRCGLASIWDALEQTGAATIRILTNRHHELEEWLKEKDYRLPVNIEVRHNQISNVHDRFAVIDYDLWHFGSTVGGAHPKLSATSHGWSNHVPPFVRLFDELWKGPYAR